jgi:hypothetical protein
MSKIKRTYINPKYATLESIRKDSSQTFDFLLRVGNRFFPDTFGIVIMENPVLIRKFSI